MNTVSFFVLLGLVVLVGVLTCAVYELHEKVKHLEGQLATPPVHPPTCSCARGACLTVSGAFRRVADEIDRGGYSP